MTLIVARRLGVSVLTIGDTRFSKQTHEPDRSLFSGGLKVVALDSTTAVCFAGDVDNAHKALGSIFKNCGRTTAWMEDHLSTYSRSGATDFLLIETRPVPSIKRFAAGSWSLEEMTWIGDPAAFNVYQAGFNADLLPHEYSHSSFRQIARRMENGFSELLGKEPATIGGFATQLGMDPDYGATYGGVSSFEGSLTDDGPQNATTATEAGSFTYALLVPKSRKVGAIAIHINEAMGGTLFFPKASWKPIQVPGTLADLIRFADEQYGLQLEGRHVHD